MAHRLLRFSAMRLLAGIGLVSAGSGACVVPIPADPETNDGGPNSPPTILHAVPDMPFGDTAGPLLLDDSIPSVTFDVKDIDVDDVITVRLYRNFQLEPDIPRMESMIPGGDVLRPVSLLTGSWCLGIEGTPNVVFEILVSDRTFLSDDVQPLFRATNGETASRAWVMDCPPL